MAPMKTLNQSNQYNSRYGEDVARQANVLASCYVVDAAGSLKGLHYCTTLAAGTYSLLCSLLRVCASPHSEPRTDYHLPGAEWYS